MHFEKEILYDISYKYKFDCINDLELKPYKLFISAFNDSSRVKDVFNRVESEIKVWIVFDEYGYEEDQFPILKNDNVKIFKASEGDEGDVIRALFKWIAIDIVSNLDICIDITGFIRPHLLFLVRYLQLSGLKSFDCIYTDPVKYKKSEETSFSDDYLKVRQVIGYQGAHSADNSNDFLIIASGYDNSRISNVAMNKDNTKKVQVFGFPSLQPDMYQQNILKAYQASEETIQTSDNTFLDEFSTIYAPANDPFVTAKYVSDFLKKVSSVEVITNLYLSPLSTKAQTLGIALFYIAECTDKEVSVIFPFCERYSKETTEGISKIWLYNIDFEIINPS